MKPFFGKMMLVLPALLCALGMVATAQEGSLSSGVTTNTGSGEYFTTMFTNAGAYNITIQCPTGGTRTLYVVVPPPDTDHKGDVNGDGQVNGADSSMMNSIINPSGLQPTALTFEQFWNADINGDGVLDAIDLEALADLISGKPVLVILQPKVR